VRGPKVFSTFAARNATPRSAPLGLHPGAAMLSLYVDASVCPPMSAKSSWSSRSLRIGRRRVSCRGQLRAPDDLCRSGNAKDLDETGHLVEQVSVSIVFAFFSQDDHGDKAGSDLLDPAGVFQNAICRGHQTTYPSK